MMMMNKSMLSIINGLTNHSRILEVLASDRGNGERSGRQHGADGGRGSGGSKADQRDS